LLFPPSIDGRAVCVTQGFVPIFPAAGSDFFYLAVAGISAQANLLKTWQTTMKEEGYEKLQPE
jgi:hypothetical protein